MVKEKVFRKGAKERERGGRGEMEREREISIKSDRPGTTIVI
jgi:hypothetical protein